MLIKWFPLPFGKVLESLWAPGIHVVLEASKGFWWSSGLRTTITLSSRWEKWSDMQQTPALIPHWAHGQTSLPIFNSYNPPPRKGILREYLKCSLLYNPMSLALPQSMVPNWRIGPREKSWCLYPLYICLGLYMVFSMKNEAIKCTQVLSHSLSKFYSKKRIQT